MTQASLSPELPSAVGSHDADHARSTTNSEAALWLFGLTSSTLVVASLLLLGVLFQSPVADTSLGGFMTATAVVIAAIGIGALTYVVVTARRAGYLGTEPVLPAVLSTRTWDGLRVIPAIPADLGRRRRKELRRGQAVRSKQARAIASAQTVSRRPAPVVAQRPASRRAAPASTPRHTPMAAPAPTRPPAHVTSRQALAAPRQAVVTPRQAVAAPRPVARPVVRQPRPAPPPAFPLMPVPIVRPRTQVALSQLAAAEIRSRTVRSIPRPPFNVPRPSVARPVVARV